MIRNGKLRCFKSYDIRGKLGEEFDEDIAWRIGRAFGELLRPDSVVVGGDARLTSDALKSSLTRGLREAGVNVIDLGLAGTEEIYFSTGYLNLGGGIEVTASHNPIDYNGMKLVAKGARPLNCETELRQIQRLVEQNAFSSSDENPPGSYLLCTDKTDYIQYLLSFIDIRALAPLKLVINSGNGAAGPVIDEIEKHFSRLAVPIQIIKLHHQPDGNFPHGIPNPLLPECRQDTQNAVISHGADMGIAFDGDFDRCFLFDENGNFIEGYYIVALLAEAFLQKSPGSKIVHDPRLRWNTIDVVQKAGGIPVQSQTGHVHIKEMMRQQDAIYGGEMSAHHYFRDFYACDSGMIPWLLVAELVSRKGTSLSTLVKQYIACYPSSGEINLQLTDPVRAIQQVEDFYQDSALVIDRMDGLSMEFKVWRFNLRCSNTEPLVRLNVESRGDSELMKSKTAEILHILQG